MDPTTWKHVERLFGEAVGLEPSEWPSFLDGACAGDADLRGEVETLLEHHRREGTLFERPVRPAPEATPPPPPDEPLEGRSVGRYRIHREIGSGGMGRVFLAERADLPKRVALKVVREPLASPERVRRFQLEQRVLARLEHPHIAQLLDAGVTDDGAPYFAMEYVDGNSLTVYCDDHRLPVAERLRLFLVVCSAVRYAHGHLVVHRDIKPSNILVSKDGRPKLLDFGVAKLLTDADAGPTRTATRVFTPNYAAPEQLTGDPVSTATDIYQLGAVLYELLAGRPPLSIDGATPAEAERIVRQQDPPSPSTAVTLDPRPTGSAGGAVARTAAEVGARRAASPQRLRGLLRGDLDNVVLKALEKDPERRYASVEALATDLERHLAGLPVSARPATPGYRLRKFVIRNKAAAAAAVLVLGYAVTATLGGLGIARERDRAEREAATAGRVSDFLVDVFTSADPADTVPGQASAMELVERGVVEVEEGLADEPEVRAAMQEALARVYQGFGRLDEAESLLRDALATRLGIFGAESLEVASARNVLAQVLWSRGDLAGADSLGLQVLAVRRDRLEPTDPRLWETLNDMGTVRHMEGDLEAAEEFLTEAVALTREAAPDGHAELGGYLSNLANVRYSDGDYAGAQEMMQEALDSDVRFLPADHPSIAIRLDNLAFMALRAGAFEDALTRAEEALAMYWRVYDAPHSDMPYAMTTIASASLALGDTARADSVHVAALELRRELGGPDHPDLFMSYRDLGNHLLATGRAGEAEPHLREALRVARVARGEDHEWYGTALWNLGRALRGLGDAEGAVDLLTRAHEQHVAALGADHPVVVDERDYLGEFLREIGREAAADSLVAVGRAARDSLAAGGSG